MANNKWVRIAILVVGLTLYAVSIYGWVHGPYRANNSANIDLNGGSLLNVPRATK